MRKRLASIALALTLSIGMMPTTAWAEDDGISVQNNATIAAKDETITVDRIMDTDNNGDAKSSKLSITGSNLDNLYIKDNKTEWNMGGTYLLQVMRRSTVM